MTYRLGQNHPLRGLEVVRDSPPRDPGVSLTFLPPDEVLGVATHLQARAGRTQCRTRHF
jgi:hypothetical protein